MTQRESDETIYDMGRKEGWLERLRPHAEWELIKWLLGIAGTFLLPLTFGLIQRARRLQVDWIGLGILFVLSLIFVSLVVYVFLTSRSKSRAHSASKLVIHSARYESTAGASYDVIEFFRQVIVGDALAFRIENHAFVAGDHNYVPKDPAPGETKWLRIQYSFDHGPICYMRREEHALLVLPEDPFLQEQASHRNDPPVDKAAVVEQNRLLEIGRSADGLFTPLQIDAFRLASEMRKFEDEVGPRPVVPTESYHGPDGAAGGLALQHSVERPWIDRLINGYALRFAQKVKELRFRFGEAGVDAYRLDQFTEWIVSENAIRECARTLDQMAVELSNRKPQSIKMNPNAPA